MEHNLVVTANLLSVKPIDLLPDCLFGACRIQENRSSGRKQHNEVVVFFDMRHKNKTS
jgi:hypothetical protein